MSRRNGGRLSLTLKIRHSLEFLKLSEAKTVTTGIKQLYLNPFFFRHVKTKICSKWIKCMCLLLNEIDFLVNAQAHKNKSKWQNAI